MPWPWLEDARFLVLAVAVHPELPVPPPSWMPALRTLGLQPQTIVFVPEAQTVF